MEVVKFLCTSGKKSSRGIRASKVKKRVYFVSSFYEVRRWWHRSATCKGHIGASALTRPILDRITFKGLVKFLD